MLLFLAPHAEHLGRAIGDWQSPQAIVSKRVQRGHATAAHHQVLGASAVLEHCHRVLPLGGGCPGGRGRSGGRGTRQHLRGERRQCPGVGKGIPQGKWPDPPGERRPGGGMGGGVSVLGVQEFLFL